MSREVGVNNLVVAFTTYNPDPSFQDNIDIAAVEAGRVLIVDDASTNGFQLFTGESLICNNFAIVRKPNNLGIADSVNAVLRFCRDAGSSHMMLFDQDTSLYAGLVSSIYQSALDHQANCINELGCFGPGVIHGRQYSLRQGSSVAHVPDVIQSGTIYSVRALDAIGGANSALVIDAVDTDICLRLRERNYCIAVDNSIAIRHPVGSGRAVHILGHSVMLTDHSATRRYYMTRNRLFLLTQRRWWRFDAQWCLIYARRFLVSSLIAGLLEEDRQEKWRAMTAAILDVVRGRLGQRSG